jgi:peroxiredoxin
VFEVFIIASIRGISFTGRIVLFRAWMLFIARNDTIRRRSGHLPTLRAEISNIVRQCSCTLPGIEWSADIELDGVPCLCFNGSKQLPEVSMIRFRFLPLVLFLSLPVATSAGLRETHTPLDAPRLELGDAEGRVHKIESYRGQVLVVNFWASWCTPCVRELPALNRLRQEFHDQPFEILAVNVAEPPSRLKRFFKKQPIDFPVLYDRQSETFYAWNVKGLPTSFVIDREGRIRYRVRGAIEWDDAETIGIIESLLGNPAEETSP